MPLQEAQVYDTNVGNLLKLSNSTETSEVVQELLVTRKHVRDIRNMLATQNTQKKY